MTSEHNIKYVVFGTEACSVLSPTRFDRNAIFFRDSIITALASVMGHSELTILLEDHMVGESTENKTEPYAF